jgi:hypothetical protein
MEGAGVMVTSADLHEVGAALVIGTAHLPEVVIPPARQ